VSGARLIELPSGRDDPTPASDAMAERLRAEVQALRASDNASRIDGLAREIDLWASRTERILWDQEARIRHLEAPLLSRQQLRALADGGRLLLWGATIAMLLKMLL
jgi:hypothetical protein